MGEILELIKAANGLSPLAIIGLLSIGIILMARGRKEANEKMDKITDNHLHELPLLIENSNRTVDILERIETKLAENFTVIKERLDGPRQN